MRIPDMHFSTKDKVFFEVDVFDVLDEVQPKHSKLTVYMGQSALAGGVPGSIALKTSCATFQKIFQA